MTVRITKSSSQVRPPSSCAFNLLIIHPSRVLAGSLSTVHAPKSRTSRLVTPVCVVKSKSKSTQTLDDYWKDLLEQLDIHTLLHPCTLFEVPPLGVNPLVLKHRWPGIATPE